MSFVQGAGQRSEENVDSMSSLHQSQLPGLVLDVDRISPTMIALLIGVGAVILAQVVAYILSTFRSRTKYLTTFCSRTKVTKYLTGLSRLMMVNSTVELQPSLCWSWRLTSRFGSLCSHLSRRVSWVLPELTAGLSKKWTASG